MSYDYSECMKHSICNCMFGPEKRCMEFWTQAGLRQYSCTRGLTLGRIHALLHQLGNIHALLEP